MERTISCGFLFVTCYTYRMQEPLSHKNCPINRLLEVVGDRWSFLIIRDVFYGVRRFDALQLHLSISKKVLSGRLRRLQQADILKKVPYQQRPLRFEYRLTCKGRDLFPVLLSMMRWGNRWLDHEESHVLKLQHQGCGEIFEPELVCGHCKQALTPAKVRAVVNPLV